MKFLSRKDAEQFGRDQRKHLGRSEMGEFKPGRRNFDPMQVIAESCRERVPQLLPIKYKLMAGSMFAFFRGSVEIMAGDLAASKNTRIGTQLCGDAHIKNFGFYATPDAQVIFDVTDFDETYPGPWEWDVKRVITSIVLAARQAGENNARSKATVQKFLAEYFRWVRRFSQMTTLDVARHRVKRSLARPALRIALEKAERADPCDNLKKLAIKSRGEWKFRRIPSQLWQVQGAERKAVLAALPRYRDSLSPDHQLVFDRFHPVDVGFKVVGTGSVGTRDYIVLMLGRDDNDPLFLQIKEAPPSIYATYLKRPHPPNEGQRVVEGQRALQVQSDVLLGWCSIEGRDYLVRQLNDHKSGLDIEQLKGQRLLEYSLLCAELLAKGHARSGDPIALAAYSGSGQRAANSLLKFAFEYARQVEEDFDTFRKALRNGKLGASVKKTSSVS
jgi:uncharacterized protein (DUF2252 family)